MHQPIMCCDIINDDIYNPQYILALIGQEFIDVLCSVLQIGYIDYSAIFTEEIIE